MNKPKYIVTPNSISLVFEKGAPVVLHRDSVAYPEAVAAIVAQDWQRLYDLAFPAAQVTRKLEKVLGTSTVHVDADQIFYNGEPLHNVVTDRILKLLSEGFDIMPMVRFLERLMKNPSFTAIQELYLFLEAANLPVDEDGYFYAYKRITSDWKDQYTKTIDNSIGATPSMPRGAVNDKRDHTCAEGLHFCAYGYLSSYGADHGGRVVIVKIDPADVVSIPSDYQNQKGRCCKYEVVREVELDGRRETSMPEERIEGIVVEDQDVGTTPTTLIAQIIPLTGQVKQYFSSAKEAAAATGLNSSDIARVLRGDRKTTGGFGWAYSEAGDSTTLPNPESKIPDDRFSTFRVNVNYKEGQYFQKQPKYEDMDDEEEDGWDEDGYN
jgi:hypothetical protein